MCLLLGLLCAACSGLPTLPLLTQRLRLIPVQPPLADLDPVWEGVPEIQAGGLRVRAVNSVQDLHLWFATDDRALQQQFSGQYGQSLLLWFAGPRSGHGLRVDFHPKPSFALSAEPVDTVDRVVTLLGPSAEGYPRVWNEGDEGIELSAWTSSGLLIYELRVPLKSGAPGSFGLDLHPGERVDVTIESAYLDRHTLEETQLADPEELARAQAAGGNPYFLRNGHAPFGMGEAVDPYAPNGIDAVHLRWRLASPERS